MCNCLDNLEYYETIDKAIAGDIVSTAIFKCTKCGKEFTESEVEYGKFRKID